MLCIGRCDLSFHSIFLLHLYQLTNSTVFSPWPSNVVLCCFDASVDNESHPKPPLAPQFTSYLFRAIFRYHSRLPQMARPSLAQSLVPSRLSVDWLWVLVAGTAKISIELFPRSYPRYTSSFPGKACSWSSLVKWVRCASECCAHQCTLHASGCIQNANISNMHSQALPIESTYFIHQTKRHNCHLLKTCPKRYNPKLKALPRDLCKQNLLMPFCYVQS